MVVVSFSVYLGRREPLPLPKQRTSRDRGGEGIRPSQPFHTMWATSDGPCSPELPPGWAKACWALKFFFFLCPIQLCPLPVTGIDPKSISAPVFGKPNLQQLTYLFCLENFMAQEGKCLKALC